MVVSYTQKMDTKVTLQSFLPLSDLENIYHHVIQHSTIEFSSHSLLHDKYLHNASPLNEEFNCKKMIFASGVKYDIT